jgi:hypothetical protein
VRLQLCDFLNVEWHLHFSPGSATRSASEIRKPQPRYAKPSATALVSAPSPNFDSTDVIRKAVFDEWKAKRMERFKKELLEKQRKEKELEDKKRQVWIRFARHRAV